MDQIDKLHKSVIDFAKSCEAAPILTLELLNNYSKQGKNLNDIVFNIVSSSKFRRTAIDNESKADVKKKINETISKNLPIEFSIPFGGDKNYRIPSYPEADWAEVFNLRFMIRYLLPIAKFYQPGVVIYYSFNSHIIHQVNNMPLEFQRAYESSFAKLVNYYNRQCPENFQLKIQQINKLYSNDDEWKSEFQSLFNRNKEKWETLYDTSTREKKLKSAKHNLILNGQRNLITLSPIELEKEYLQAAMMCDAIDSLSKRRDFNKYSHRIQLVFIRGPRPAIHIGVCEGATMHFWAGLGIFEVRENKIIPIILSFNQLQELKSTLISIEVESSLTSISNNLNKILFKYNKSNRTV